MSEPRLEDIGDYNQLKGEKKKTVWMVVIVGLIIGTIYVVTSNKYGNVEDSVQITDPIEKVRIK